MKDTEILLPTAARTGAQTVTHVTEHSQCIVTLNVNAVNTAASATLGLTINGIDPVDSQEWTILSSSGLGTGLTVLKVSPYLNSAASAIAKDILPGAIEITVTPANTGSFTYGLGFVGMD